MPAVNGREIRRRRQRTGMKLGQFAEYARVGYQTLANIESKNQRTSIEIVHRIADALAALGQKCEADDLLADEEPEPRKAAAL